MSGIGTPEPDVDGINEDLELLRFARCWAQDIMRELGNGGFVAVSRMREDPLPFLVEISVDPETGKCLVHLQGAEPITIDFNETALALLAYLIQAYGDSSQSVLELFEVMTSDPGWEERFSSAGALSFVGQTPPMNVYDDDDGIC